MAFFGVVGVVERMVLMFVLQVHASSSTNKMYLHSPFFAELISSGEEILGYQPSRQTNPCNNREYHRNTSGCPRIATKDQTGFNCGKTGDSLSCMSLIGPISSIRAHLWDGIGGHVCGFMDRTADEGKVGS